MVVAVCKVSRRTRCPGYLAGGGEPAYPLTVTPSPPRRKTSSMLEVDDEGGRMLLRVLIHLTMHDYAPLVSGALQLLFKHFSQRQEVMHTFKQVCPPSPDGASSPQGGVPSAMEHPGLGEVLPPSPMEHPALGEVLPPPLLEHPALGEVLPPPPKEHPALGRCTPLPHWSTQPLGRCSLLPRWSTQPSGRCRGAPPSPDGAPSPWGGRPEKSSWGPEGHPALATH